MNHRSRSSAAEAAAAGLALVLVHLLSPHCSEAAEAAPTEADAAASPDAGAPAAPAPAPVAPPDAAAASIPGQGPGPGAVAPLGPGPAAALKKGTGDGPLAGYSDGAFYLRSPGNNFVLFPNGRLNVDGAFFLNRGDPPSGPPPGGAPGTVISPDSPPDQRPRNSIFIRRARAELGGTIAKHFDFYISGEFATDPIFFQYASFVDVWLNVNYTPWANIMVGQFDAPFSLENRTPDKFIDFMERSLAVRALGVPTNKELGAMVWGQAPGKHFQYTVGVFNGDGGQVRNVDSRFDIIGRATFSPLAFLPGAKTTRWMTDIWLGGSIWWGQRASPLYPVLPVTTQGGATLMPPLFAVGNTTYNLGDDGDLLKWAVEVNAPVGPFGLRFELVRLQQGLGDQGGVALHDKPPTPAGADRTPIAHYRRSGTAFYVQAWYWILGDYRMLPSPGTQVPKRWQGYKQETGPFKVGLYVTAKYERLQLSMEDTGQSAGVPLVNQALLGGLTVDSAEAAVNLWVSKHVRFSVNYVMNYLDGDMKLIQGGYKFPQNGPLIQPTTPFYQRAEHELLLRAAVGL